MDRILAILLLAFMVLGNSLAQCHGIAAHASSSGGRAHFHIGSGHEHTHHHDGHHRHGSHGHQHHGHQHHGHQHDHDGEESDSDPLTPADHHDSDGDHDSDAVYVVSADLVYTVPVRSSIDIDTYSVVGFVEANRPAKSHVPMHASVTLATKRERPLYLLHAALRL